MSKITRIGKGKYRLNLTQDEAIKLVGQIAFGVGKLKVRHENRRIADEGSFGGQYRRNGTDGLFVQSFYNADKPELEIRINLDDLED